MSSKFTSQAEWQDGPNGLSWFTKRWLPSGPTVAKMIFVHGFTEHILRYDHVYSRYAEAGIEVFAFDQRGFGQTAAKTNTRGQTSWPEALSDLEFIVKKEASSSTVKVFLMGHSMAPAIAAPRLFLVLGRFVGAVLPRLTFKAGVSPKDICRDPVIQEQYANDPYCVPVATFKGVSDMLLGGQALLNEDYRRFPSDLPILAVHGTGDKVTNWLATKQLVEKTDAEDKEFEEFEGYYHEMHNEPDPDKIKEMDHIIGWIKKHA